ncbi:hypothetical protein Csp1_23070 [Corynebacterium provencense]|uniref:Uncharacterized protein n=1 Tax=Corynebacterium provencense TaxID=1737425 RepID=A0A2Z3YY87_9CORY|nr:hypothetical protein [Corynebacterium provencense]AWT27057.1 hypothetical protein Csp1_23070 [Corynebacterium provencense]
MSRYTLYRSLGLDRSRDPQQLAAQLDQWLKMPDQDALRLEELRVARAILGDPWKRTEYDRRIDDPAAAPMSLAELTELAARVHTTGWGRPRPAQTPHPASGGPTGATVLAGLSSTYRTRILPALSRIRRSTGEIYRAHPKPAVAATAVAALAVVGLGVAGVRAVAGDDEKTGYVASSNLGSGAAGSRGTSGTSGAEDSGDSNSKARSQFQNYTFLSAGEELTFTTGQLYTYDDGHTERSPEGGEFGVTVDNVRTIDRMSRIDPSAPANHPDAVSHRDGTLVCYDMTLRVIRETAHALEAKSRYRNYDPVSSEYVTHPTMWIIPVIENSYLGKILNTDSYSVPPGSTAPIIYDENSGWGTEDGADKEQYSPDRKSVTESSCYVVAEEGTGNRRGVTADGSEPSNYTGYVVSTSLTEPEATPSKDVRGWRFDH